MFLSMFLRLIILRLKECVFYTSEFESYWVPHSYGHVLHLSKKLCKLLYLISRNGRSRTKVFLEARDEVFLTNIFLSKHYNVFAVVIKARKLKIEDLYSTGNSSRKATNYTTKQNWRGTD